MKIAAVLVILSPWLLTAQAPPFTLQQSYPVAEPLPSAFSIASGDLNGDGVPEILIGRTGGIAVYDPARAVFGPAIGTGCNIQALTLADFDRDGALDLATFCAPTGTFELRRGDGGGGFQKPSAVRLQAVERFPGLAAADLDQDGNPDLAVTQPGGLALLFGAGDGSFRPARRLAIGSRFSPATPSSVVAADFDNNGIPDLATANIIYNDDISIFLGAGAGEFKPEVKIATSQRPTALTATDFDQDGNTDLVVAAQGATILLAGRGDGGFLRSEFATDAHALSVAAGDLNSDGLPDLAVGMYYGGMVAIYLNQGGRRFEEAAPVASVSDVSSVMLTDLNGDSLPDLVAGSFSASLALLAPGRGDSGFQPPIYLGTWPANSLLLRSFKAGDATTLAVVSEGARVITFLRNGSDPWRLATQAYPIDARFGDFDNDGITDMLTASIGGWTGAPGSELGAALVFYRGNAGGAFEQAAATDFSFPVLPGVSYDYLLSMLTMVTGDFNGDRILDAAISNFALRELQVYLGAGDGTFRIAQTIPRGFGVVVSGDFNADGLTDIAIAGLTFDGPSRVTLYWGSRESSPLREQSSHAVCDAGTSGMRLETMQPGDFDGDKRLDLAFHCASNLVILRNAEQGFQLVTASNPSGSAGEPPLIAVADFDNDGKDDIAEARAGFGGPQPSTRILVYRGNALGMLSPPSGLTITSAAVAITAFDADGDGKIDLALSDAQTGRIQILRNRF